MGIADVSRYQERYYWKSGCVAQPGVTACLQNLLFSGSFVIEYVGEIIDDEEFKVRMARKHKEKDENYYFLTIDSNRMIDAGPKGNVAR